MWAAQSLINVAGIMFAGSLWQVPSAIVKAEQISEYENRMVAQAEGADRNGTNVQFMDDNVPPTRLEGEVANVDAGSTLSAEFIERLRQQIPDPETARNRAEKAVAETTGRLERETITRLIDRLAVIDRPDKLRLTLEDALRRALVNSYSIRVSSYNPAIETTRVVEAEAAFDAAFFINVTNDKQDRPAVNQLSGTQIQTFNGTGGVRKLLPSGMQVEAAYLTQRSSNNFAFQTVNPIWFSQFVVQFRQPLLRGFGLDYNRSQIKVSELNRRRSTQGFRREIRDTLRETEEAYWRLTQARRNLVINARLLASFEQLYGYLEARQEFDVYRIQLADTKARLERAKAGYIELTAAVFNTQDQLIALINDPELNLIDELEIIPVDAPHFVRPVIDRVAEVQTALENRSEMIEAKLAIDIARVQVGVAKNQTMPQLDLTFRYAMDGIGESHHDAFSNVTRNEFHEYFVGVDFELPIGNRARRAALKRAKLQYAQSLAALKQTFEQIILDVNVAVRAVQVRFDQIDPGLLSVEASEDQVLSIRARAEKKDFLTLNNELNTEQQLAQNRSDLLGAIVEYGIALIDLERAKGTLLHYDSVDLVFDDSDDPAL